MTKNENEEDDEDVVEMDEVFKKHILARYGQEGLDFYDTIRYQADWKDGKVYIIDFSAPVAAWPWIVFRKGDFIRDIDFYSDEWYEICKTFDDEEEESEENNREKNDTEADNG